MSSTDPIGDLITRIRNGQRRGKTSVSSPGSNLRKNFLEVLKKEGYITGFESKEISKGKAELSVQLKYSNGEPVIKEIARISKPGRRVYSKIRDLPRHYSGLGISILSTPRGLMSDAEARAAKIGGELLCKIF